MRYLHFSYNWSKPREGLTGFGSLWAEYNSFPSLKQVKRGALKVGVPEDAEMVILGWNEFSNKQDFLDFSQE